MKTEINFKTNIKCNGCIATVKPHLDKIDGISWQVNLEHPDKILHVESETHTEADNIIQALKDAGYEATLSPV